MLIPHEFKVGDRVRIIKDQSSDKARHLKLGDTGVIMEFGWEAINPGLYPLHPNSHPPRIRYALLKLDVEPVNPPFGYSKDKFYWNSIPTYDLELIDNKINFEEKL